MTQDLKDITAVTRLDLSMKAYTTACARLRALESEALLAFREYHDARDRLADDHGVTADMELNGGIAAAYSLFKQELAKAEGRKIASVA
jgi:hypothetical protein